MGDNGKAEGWRQYPSAVAGEWDAFIDWKARGRGEGDFFVRQLRRFKCRRVLDAACGTGYDSIRLLRQGFDVVSLDGSRQMLEAAGRNARSEGVALKAVHSDWREMGDAFSSGSFDAVLMLGNSLTHLFERRDRELVLGKIHGLLRPRGILLLDQRNYDMILDIGYKSKHNYVYCGENFEVVPVVRTEELVRLGYFGKKAKWFFDLFPIRLAEIAANIRNSGFRRVETYGDFQRPFGKYDADFLQHVAVKPNR